MRWVTVIALLAAAAATSAAASATTAGYTITLKAPTRIAAGHTFDVHISGSAAKRSVLNVFLDRRACAAGAEQEGGRPATPRPGDSYFISPEGAHVDFYSVPVKGSYDRTAVAHAGTTHERENLCAYLNVLGAPTPASVARATRRFTIVR